MDSFFNNDKSGSRYSIINERSKLDKSIQIVLIILHIIVLVKLRWNDSHDPKWTSILKQLKIMQY